MAVAEPFGLRVGEHHENVIYVNVELKILLETWF
jgi:hypothetical protein